MEQHAVRPVSRWSLTWRVAASLGLIALLLNGSARMHDDAWPFGPQSQYAFAPPPDASVVITRVEGRLADGRRIDLPLRTGQSGISRSEVEPRIADIEADPALLQVIADGWSTRHPDEPAVEQVWLVQDRTVLVDGRQGPTVLDELATWVSR